MSKKTFFILLTLVAISGIFYVGRYSYEGMPEKAGSKGSEENISITIRAGNSLYGTVVPEDSSVYDVMKILASTTSFKFKSTQHSGLGYFIEEINGITNSGGTYWTLYVNELYSMTGASQYFLKNNDSIEWKYEKK